MKIDIELLLSYSKSNDHLTYVNKLELHLGSARRAEVKSHLDWLRGAKGHI